MDASDPYWRPDLEPNKGNNLDCVALRKDTGEWINRKCNPTKSRHFICQQSKYCCLENNSSLSNLLFEKEQVWEEIPSKRQNDTKLHKDYRSG